MHEIIPGILEREWSEIERKIELTKSFAKAIHVDLLDGKFAPNTSFLDPAPFATYASDVFLELHMMVEEPIIYLKRFAIAGFRRFIAQVEMMTDQADFVAEAQRLGEVVLAVDAPTNIDSIRVPYIDLDGFLIMTVKAGFSGQSFLPENLKKAKALRSKTALPIEIDGGVNDTHVKEALAVGVNRFVATSFLFKSDSPENQYKLLQKSCKTIEGYDL
ncbi:MAG: hypothetical protein HY431_01740 [Candidatus Levybacteria bacterium]|nr:hypothetical protein [Candidatus Levybacteria bacterium]